MATIIDTLKEAKLVTDTPEKVEVTGFVFSREGLVKILSEMKYNSNLTVDKFLKNKGIKYL